MTTTTTGSPGSAYPFDDRRREHDRLVAQAPLIDPLTRRLFDEAGLAPGMRVLDLGSGAGSVARLAAEYVAPCGKVLGIDADPAAVELARSTTPDPCVEYAVANIAALDDVPGTFDAAVGRMALMYVPDPVATLRRIAERIRPGGLICLHEADLEYPAADPVVTPTFAQVQQWFTEALRKGGFWTRLGPSLFTTFRTAGLPGPSLLVEATAQGGPDAPSWAWANVIAAAVPLMERFGVASREEVGPETLAQRLHAEVQAAEAGVSAPPMTGAWTRLPPG